MIGSSLRAEERLLITIIYQRRWRTHIVFRRFLQDKNTEMSANPTTSNIKNNKLYHITTEVHQLADSESTKIIVLVLSADMVPHILSHKPAIFRYHAS